MKTQELARKIIESSSQNIIGAIKGQKLIVSKELYKFLVNEILTKGETRMFAEYKEYRRGGWLYSVSDRGEGEPGYGISIEGESKMVLSEDLLKGRLGAKDIPLFQFLEMVLGKRKFTMRDWVDYIN